MKVIKVRNVNEALPVGLRYLCDYSQREDSRAGPVLVSPVPVTTVYERPMERVLINGVRDANPFFHLMEAMWMLAGRGDAAFLNNFIRDFGERFAEPDGMIHGAYGARWRSHFYRVMDNQPPGARPGYTIDQLGAIVRELRTNPLSRQVVLQMWDAEVDLGVQGLKDRPCNTQVYFRVRRHPEVEPSLRVLDMTVTCRSNDIIWGAYGANAVHFAFLQEYVAQMVGVEVGTYYQVSNNYHAYTSELDRLCGKLNLPPNSYYELSQHLDSSGREPRSTVTLVSDPLTFDRELLYLLQLYEVLDCGPPIASAHTAVSQLNNKFLSETVWPMMMLHRYYRDQEPELIHRWGDLIKAEDWRWAAQDWVKRRTPR